MTSLVIQGWPYENSHEGSYLLRREFTPEASYALRNASAIPSVIDSLTANATSRIGTLANTRMNVELSELVSLFTASACEPDLDISRAPPLEVVDAEDGSVLIEWQFRDRRLGFNIEPDEGQSGWYFAFSRDSGGQCGSGLLASLAMRDLLRLILSDPPRR